MKRPLFALALVALLSFVCVHAVLRIVAPAPAPADVKPRPLGGPRLAKHLLFVIVDGLRYDIATDARRMPHFASAMQRRRSAEIWAGPVSMTTSAVLAYGTGQPGRLEQIVRNVNPKPPPFNSWLENAKAAGLRIVTVGDPAWVEMYGPAIAAHHLDPKGVAIDVDFNPQTFRAVRALRSPPPDVLIAHFGTPDHQGHAYGIQSDRYTEHIRSYDAELAALLAEFGPEWTIVVTSDHGAADSGTHGSDVPIQRRSPIFAYGPGIAPKQGGGQRLDQLDLASTLAALLAVSPPAHGRGHVITDWLDVDDATRAELACNDAAHLTELARAITVSKAALELPDCGNGSPPAKRLQLAQSIAEQRSAELGRRSDGAANAWPLVLLVVVLGGVLSWLVFGRAVLRTIPFAIGLVAVSLFLLYGVERLPGNAPNGVRAVLFVASNLAVLWALLRPGQAAAFLEARPALGPVIVPGMLVVSYTTNAQPEAYAMAWVGAVLFGLAGTITPRSAPLLKGRLRVARLTGLFAIFSLLVLFPAGTQEKDFYPELIARNPHAALAAAVVFVLLWAVSSFWHSSHPRWAPLALVSIIVGSLLLRRMSPPLLGRSAIVVFAFAALWAARAGQRYVAIGFGLASYAWVSRDFELIALVASLIVVDHVSFALAPRSSEEAPTFAQALLVLTFLFGLAYVQRIGIQGALDIGFMDWGAGGFGDPYVPAVLVGSALAYKYVLAALLAFATLLSRLPAGFADRVACSLVVVYGARTVCLLLMLFFCNRSFWTALRVLGDLPFGLTGAVAAALAWVGCRVPALMRRQNEPFALAGAHSVDDRTRDGGAGPLRGSNAG